MFETINWNIIDRIGYLCLAAPPQNAMGLKFFSEFSALMDIISSTSDLRGLIIYGKGRHFSSGTDVRQLFSLFSGADKNIPDSITQNINSLIKMSELPFPVVSAIRGVCLGSAFELALLSHFRIAATNALLGLPESSFDILSGLGGILNMCICAGKAKTMELVLSGESFSANEALHIGLIDFVGHRKRIIPLAESLINFIDNNYQKGFRNRYLRAFRANRLNEIR
ncbi:MAG: enoyl-CoA hydratase/isomerase family protein [Bacteroidetes bacterium]|nr:enoyl-CoA hydratase/isomerase family protein [Bacteroidota bacterium]